MPAKQKQTPAPSKSMSNTHKAALAQGRTEGRAVRTYLEALRANKPRRGRKRSADTISKRLAAIDDHLTGADAVTELRLIQERRDLVAELESFDRRVDLGELEEQFVKVARSYSERQGISYESWRDVGVDAAVLKRAGIARTGR